MVFPVFSKHFQERVRGSIMKPATCEECGTEYVYRVDREGKGQGSSIYFLDNDGAQVRAYEAAQRSLRKALESKDGLGVVHVAVFETGTRDPYYLGP